MKIAIRPYSYLTAQHTYMYINLFVFFFAQMICDLYKRNEIRPHVEISKTFGNHYRFLFRVEPFKSP